MRPVFPHLVRPSREPSGSLISIPPLQSSYTPQLDPALVYAILSDYTSPLSATDELSARQTLDSLAQDAQQTDPSFAEVGIAGDSNGEGSSARGDGSAAASVSELSSQLEASSLSLSEGGGGGRRSADPERRSPAGRAFWDKSAASLTSEEENGAAKFAEYGLDEFTAYDDLGGGGDDPLAFLASVFPDMDLLVLQKKLEGTPYADGTPAALVDLEALVEELLCQDLITSLNEEEADSAAEEAGAWQAAGGKASKQQRRREKAEQKAHSSFSLTSTPHLERPSSAASHRATRSRDENDLTSSALFSASSTSNAWASISSHATYLSALMHIDPTRVSSTYYQQKSSLPATITVLLSQLAADRPFSSLPDGDDLKASLRSLVPPGTLTSIGPVAQEDELEALLCATEGDVSDALDLHAFVSDVQRSLGKNLVAWSLLAAADAPLSSAEVTKKRLSDGFTTVSNARRRASPETSYASLPSTSSAHATHLTSASTPTPAFLRLTADDCRALASEALQNRNEAFRAAARAFQKGHGRGVEKGGATVQSEKGRMYEKERRKWEEEAARRTIGERRCVVPRWLLLFYSLKGTGADFP